jgi:diadenosine tetraphosphate (Ap4A) HIT family hydrolase
MTDCRFCDRIRANDFNAENEQAVAFADTYPLTQGHTLVIPRTHVSDLFALTPTERAKLWELVDVVHAALMTDYKPDGFNIGVNVLRAAGQTIDHAHVHVIPRYEGDVADPRGGVRWVIPAKAAYWDNR